MLAALARGSVGAVPIVGNLVAEVVDQIIPGQKLDRVVAFVEVLADQVKMIDANQALLDERLRAPEGSDLLEEGIVQASRAVTNERRERIARVLLSGISQKSLEYDRTKKLLSILGDLTDSELVLLELLLSASYNWVSETQSASRSSSRNIASCQSRARTISQRN